MDETNMIHTTEFTRLCKEWNYITAGWMQPQIMLNQVKPQEVNVTFPLICGPQNSLEINKLYTKSAWVREHVCTHGDVYM